MIRRWMMTLVLTLPVLGMGVEGAPQRLDRIVAVVDEAVVLESDVFKKIRFEIMSKGIDIRSIREEQIQEMFHKILENEIQRHLLLARAREDSIEVEENQIIEMARQQIRQLKAQNGEAAFAEELKKQGITEREIRREFEEQIRNQYLERRMYETLSQRVSVTAKDVETFQEAYRAGQSDLLSVSHILAELKPSESRKAEAREKAEALLKRVEAGEDFGELARASSEDPGSAANGGDLGFFSKGTMVPEFEDVAFSLRPGETSEIVETVLSRSPLVLGFHIIRVEEIDGGQVRARHILITLRGGSQDGEAARQKALELYKRVQAGEDFAILAKTESDHEETASLGGRLGAFQKESLPPAFADVIRTLQIGAVSLPVQTEFGWHLVKVNDDLVSLEEIARQVRLQELFREVLAETREKLYVEVRLE